MENSPITRAVEKTLPAVVSITASKKLSSIETPFASYFPGFNKLSAQPKGKKRMKTGGGSGFIVEKDGTILTNRHVVSDSRAKYVVVLNNEKRFKAKILARDPLNDIAVLKINAENLPIIELGDSSDLKLGQSTIAIGNALGMFRNTVSTGVVSGLSRKITAGEPTLKRFVRLKGLIQTDAAVNPGNSGGPLIDIEGKAIGINSAMVLLAENIGFALPINAAKNALKDIKQYGRIRRPFLGIRYVLLDKELKEAYNLPLDKGALIVSEDPSRIEAVIPNSPAKHAGIREQDIVVSAKNQEITTENTLEDILQDLKVGDKLKVEVLREGKKKTFKIILAEAR